MSFFERLTGRASRLAFSLSLAMAATTLMAGNAFAVSLRVQIACAADYYAHCSAYSPDGPQVRSCMRAVGRRLSASCVSALVAAGEVSAAEVARHRRATETALK